MKIKWYGHACFRIEGDGISIVTDPYTPEITGLDSVDEPADVVVMSSATDKFHSNASMVPGDPKVLNALEIARSGPVEVNGVLFEALPTMESLRHKESPDENAIYRFELEGVSVLHLGDLGNPLNGEQLNRLRGRRGKEAGILRGRAELGYAIPNPSDLRTQSRRVDKPRAAGEGFEPS